MELAPGVVTSGWFDLRPIVDRMPWPDVRGKRCLDIGTYDGFLAFELERRGAAEVVCTDVDDHRGWDWPAHTRLARAPACRSALPYGSVVQGATHPDPEELGILRAAPHARTQVVEPPDPWHRPATSGLAIVRHWRSPQGRLRRRAFPDYLTHVPLSYLSLLPEKTMSRTRCIPSTRWPAPAGASARAVHRSIPRWACPPAAGLVEARYLSQATMRAATASSEAFQSVRRAAPRRQAGAVSTPGSVGAARARRRSGGHPRGSHCAGGRVPAGLGLGPPLLRRGIRARAGRGVGLWHSGRRYGGGRHPRGRRPIPGGPLFDDSDQPVAALAHALMEALELSEDPAPRSHECAAWRAWLIASGAAESTRGVACGRPRSYLRGPRHTAMRSNAVSARSSRSSKSSAVTSPASSSGLRRARVSIQS